MLVCVLPIENGGEYHEQLVRPDTRLERDADGNANIYKPEGTYSVIYARSHHTVQEIPSIVADRLDGIFLETADDYLRDPLLAVRFYANRVPEYPKPQYEQIVRLAEKQHIPVYLGDAKLKVDYPADLALLLGEQGFALGQTAIGAALLAKVGLDAARNPISRRDFLKLGTKAAIGAWMLPPGLSLMARGAANVSGRAEGITAEGQKISHRLHPEQMVVTSTIRNTLLAHKEQWLMEQTGTTPHFATIIGAGHVQIEDAIQASPQDRLAFLRLVRPVLKTAFVPEEVYKMVRLDYKEHWEIGNELAVPELRQLLAD